MDDGRMKTYTMKSRSTFENLMLTDKSNTHVRSRLKYLSYTGEVESSRKTNGQLRWFRYAHLTRRSVWLVAWKHLRGPNCKHTSSDKAYIFLSTTIHQIRTETHQNIDTECDGSYALYLDFIYAEVTSRSRPAAPLPVPRKCHVILGKESTGKQRAHQLSRHPRYLFSFSMTKAQSLAALIGADRVAKYSRLLHTGQS
jgi:hypothetical protein